MLASDSGVTAGAGANRDYFLGSQLGATIADANHSGRSALDDHVGHVFSMAAEKQMAGSDAARVVATVTDKHAGRNFAVSQFVRHTVRTELGAVLVLDQTIPLRHLCT